LSLIPILIFGEFFNRDLGVAYNRVQRFLIAQPVFDTRKRVILCQASLQLIRRLAIHPRHPLDFGVKILAADLGVFVGADPGDDQRRANVTSRAQASLVYSLGSSGFSVGSLVEIESPAVEEDRALEVLAVAEAVGHLFDPLDFRVQPLAGRVRHSVAEVRENAR